MRQTVQSRIDLETLGWRILKDVESRTHSFVCMLSNEARRRLHPLLTLPFPSQQEVHRLSRRIGQLERRLGSHPGAKAAAARRRTARSASSVSAAGKQVLDSRTYADLFWDEV